MQKITLALIFLVTLLLASYSGGSPQATPADPAPATVDLTTNPSPAKVGAVELRFSVTDGQGQPLTGADFDVFADHTDMTGMTMHGKAVEQGQGIYSITANFSMVGNWKLSIGVKTDSLEHKQDLELKIQ